MPEKMILSKTEPLIIIPKILHDHVENKAEFCDYFII